MAKVDFGALPPLSGKVGDLVYYWLEDSWVVRRAGRVSKEAYRTGKQFALLRKNQNEFGLASQTSRVIRKALGPLKNCWSDGSSSGRICGALRRCLQEGRGSYGQRWLEVNHLGLYVNSGLFSRKVNTQMVYRPEELIKFCEPQDEEAPLGALVFLSDVAWGANGYAIVQPDWHGRSMIWNMQEGNACAEVAETLALSPEGTAGLCLRGPKSKE